MKGRAVEHAEHLERDRLWRSVVYYAGKRGVSYVQLCDELRLAMAVTSPQGKPGRKAKA